MCQHYEITSSIFVEVADGKRFRRECGTYLNQEGIYDLYRIHVRPINTDFYSTHTFLRIFLFHRIDRNS